MGIEPDAISLIRNRGGGLRRVFQRRQFSGDVRCLLQPQEHNAGDDQPETKNGKDVVEQNLFPPVEIPRGVREQDHADADPEG